MIREADIRIYRTISKEMNATELYLGAVAYPFRYTKAMYRATCTEAIPFNPFDKVICELLKIEESLSFEEIGDILGMNVYASESPGKYPDLAEREILTEAIQSLASDDFGRMVETGDIQMSKCSLTATGREYAEKKCKFKTIENKPFVIFFDHTTGSHKFAKQHFEFVKGSSVFQEFDIGFADESTLKEIASVQVPETYDPEQQHSFTDPVLIRQEEFTVDFPVAVTSDVNTGIFRFHCLDQDVNEIHEHFNQWVNENDNIKQEILQFLKANMNTGTARNAVDVSFLAEKLSVFAPDAKIPTVKQELLNLDLIDEPLLLDSLGKLMDLKEEIVLYLCLPNVSQALFESLNEILQQSENEDSRYYFIFPEVIPDECEDILEQWFGLADEEPNLYVMQRSVKSFFLGVKATGRSYYFEYVQVKTGDFLTGIFQRNVWNEENTRMENSLLEQFSDDRILEICDEAVKAINQDMEEQVNSDQLRELAFFEFKLQPFRDIGKNAKTVRSTLDLVHQFKVGQTERFYAAVSDSCDRIEGLLHGEISDNKLHEAGQRYDRIDRDMITQHTELSKRLTEIESLMQNKRAELEEAKKVYHFIIDTNMFITDPDILSGIERKHKVIIAPKVLDELNSFKRNPELKETASKSIALIFKNKNKNIRRGKANLKLLPPGFSGKSPDDLILALAIDYIGKNGILITDDKGLMEKCKTVNVEVLTTTSFINKFVKQQKS